MLVHFDRRRCVGHAHCYAKAPEFFGLDQMGYCQLRTALVPKELEAKVRAGVESCPEGALAIADG